jgi:hypothetical protein
VFKYVFETQMKEYEELKITIDNIIKNRIKKKHLKNYFKYLFIQAKNYILSLKEIIYNIVYELSII